VSVYFLVKHTSSVRDSNKTLSSEIRVVIDNSLINFPCCIQLSIVIKYVELHVLLKYLVSLNNSTRVFTIGCKFPLVQNIIKFYAGLFFYQLLLRS